MNGTNTGLVEEVQMTLARWRSRDENLDGLQEKLQQVMSLVENDGSNIRAMLAAAEADIEFIQFAVLRAEQQAAADGVVEELRTSLGGL